MLVAGQLLRLHPRARSGPRAARRFWAAAAPETGGDVPQLCGPGFRRGRDRPASARLHATRYSCHCVDSPRAKQVFAGPLGSAVGAVLGKVRGLPPMCPAQGYCAGPAQSRAFPRGPSLRRRGLVLAGHCDAVNGSRPVGAVTE